MAFGLSFLVTLPHFDVAVPKMQPGTWTVDGIAVCHQYSSKPGKVLPDPGGGGAWVTGTLDGSGGGKTIPQFTPTSTRRTRSRCGLV